MNDEEKIQKKMTERGCQRQKAHEEGVNHSQQISIRN